MGSKITPTARFLVVKKVLTSFCTFFLFYTTNRINTVLCWNQKQCFSRPCCTYFDLKSKTMYIYVENRAKQFELCTIYIYLYNLHVFLKGTLQKAGKTFGDFYDLRGWTIWEILYFKKRTH